MSGQMFSKDNFTDYLKRRSFLLRLGLVTGGIFLNGCYKKIKSGAYKINGQLLGPNAKAGHLLRDRIPLPRPSASRKVKTLIIGSGISGLSAARWLKMNGRTDFEIHELENNVGGNSSFAKNKVSSYPLGAHYITIPNNEDGTLIDFLKEIDVITHFEKGLPYYNEYYLTFDPEERLLINGQWQEGLIPDFGVPEKDKAQIKRFLKHVEELRNHKGSDGKFSFNIPISASSSDNSLRQLDKISFAKYLEQHGYTSKYLLWYLNYACKDDYGQKLDRISAWAGLHYFASRRGTAANAEQNAILTWSEGNGWLMQKLADPLENHIHKSSLCYNLKLTSGGVEAAIYDTKTEKTTLIEAEQVILATPQFVNQKLLQSFDRDIDYKFFNYSPWIIANITISELPGSKGVNLSWDNVAYGTPSVGYVNAAQQHLSLHEDRKVISFYLPLCDFEPAIARLAAYSRTYDQWLDIIIPELEHMHPNITEAIENIDIWVWGHGMIAPTQDFIWSEHIKNARKPIKNKIFFAHTDLSGISIFEEAFHQGIAAAKQVLQTNV